MRRRKRDEREKRSDITTSCDGKITKQLPEEPDLSRYHWTWDENFKRFAPLAMFSQRNTQVMLNPIYSTGTSLIRGNTLLEKGRHHFWEIEMMTKLYGTDVMVGVGTVKAMTEHCTGFCSLLGQNSESWGLSYTGLLHHDGKFCNYSPSFGQYDLIGVHFDTWAGTLQFFLNRRPLGIIFTRLNNLRYYPLISSTIADCKMKLTYSVSIPVSLQSACLKVLTPSQKQILWIKFPALRYLCQLADMLQNTSHDYCNMCHHACLSLPCFPNLGYE